MALSKKLKNLYYFFATSKIRNRGKNNQIIFNKNIRFKDSEIRVNGHNNKIIIEDDILCQRLQINVSGDNHEIVLKKGCSFKNFRIGIKGNRNKVEIGEGTTNENKLMILLYENNNKVVIGKDCMFSHDILIRTTDSHSILDLKSKKRINFAKDVYIGNHVWIGAYVKILKGVQVADNAIIGLNSVVTKNVDSNTIVIGIPARPVKSGVTWTRTRYYEDDIIPDDLFLS